MCALSPAWGGTPWWLYVLPLTVWLHGGSGKQHHNNKQTLGIQCVYGIAGFVGCLWGLPHIYYSLANCCTKLPINAFVRFLIALKLLNTQSQYPATLCCNWRHDESSWTLVLYAAPETCKGQACDQDGQRPSVNHVAWIWLLSWYWMDLVH